MSFFCFFFFKQKTAYDVRISDWSSDVCSSDLLTRALMDEEYDVWGVACSTKGSATLVIVNGPVRSEIAINCGTNVFGPGFRANATIGRAVRLMILNLGGARPNELDKGTLRSEERRVGKEGVSTCRNRWS